MKMLVLMLTILSTAALADPSYTQDVQPVFKNRCSQCHDHIPGKNWMEYDTAFEFRDSIRTKILTKEMPMGRDMPQPERDLIVKWVETGAKR